MKFVLRSLALLLPVFMCGFSATAHAASFSSSAAGTWNSGETWGATIFNHPLSITTDSSGNVYLADTNNNRIVKFDPTGNILMTFGSAGSTEGEFAYPTGIAIDHSGNIYVSDEQNHRIQKFSANGTFIAAYGWSVADNANHYEICTSNCQQARDGGFDGEFIYPSGIAVDSSNNVYVADRGTGLIDKFDPSGNFIAKYQPTFNGQYLSGPRQISIDASDNIFIADQTNSRIVELNSSGTAIAAVSGNGNGDGQVNNPGGISVSTTTGNLYVADTFNNRIQKLQSNGMLITMYGWGVIDDLHQYETCTSGCHAGVAGTGDGAVYNPFAVAVDPSGNIYVADYANSRVVKINANGTFAGNFIGSEVAGVNYPASTDDVTIAHTVTLQADETVHDVTITTGTLDLNGHTLTVTGALDLEGGTLSIDGGSVSFSHALTIHSGSTLTLPLNETATTVSIGSGSTLDLNGHTLAVSADFTNGGTFTANGGTVNLTGTNQTISGNNTFYNLTKTTSTADTLYFTGAQTVTGTLSLGGAAGNLLTLRNPVTQTLQYITKWGQQGGGPGQFQSPSGIAIDSHNDIYVVESSNQVIEKFDANGNFITQWGSAGTAEGQFDFDYPDSIAVDSHDNVFVSDLRNQRVQEFTPTGTFIKMWGWGVQDGASQLEVCTSGCQAGISGTGTGQLNYSYGIAIDSHDNVYVDDSDDSYRIEEFDSSGNFIKTYGWGVTDGASQFEICTSNCQTGLYGSGAGAFTGGYVGIVIDAQDNLYHADYSNQRIDEFDTNGNFVKAWGWGVADGASQLEVCTSGCQAGIAGDGDGQFNYPYYGGIAINRTTNDIYVGDEGGTSGGQIFSTNGSFIGRFSSHGSADDQINYNAALALDTLGNLFVVNDATQEVKKFGLITNWSINPSLAASFSYLDVIRSDDTGATLSCLTGCVDGGGNTNWEFPTPAAPVQTVPSQGSHTGGGSVQNQVSTLEHNGNVALAMQLKKQFATIFSVPQTPPTTKPTSSVPVQGSVSYGRTLSMGSSGTDVHLLQKYLNAHGFTIATSGSGSPGNETTFFGKATRVALAKFQKAKGIVPATGYFGPLTKAYVLTHA